MADKSTSLVAATSGKQVFYSSAAQLIRDSDWRQLKCRTQHCKYERSWVLCVYFALFVFCIVVGVICLNAAQSVSYQQLDAYHNVAECKVTDGNYGHICNLTFQLKHDFDTPVYFYYKLTDVYQNHRRYVQSRSEKQLTGHERQNLRECDPRKSYDGQTLLPCGLIAYSFFNDKIKPTLIRKNGDVVDMCPDCDGDAQGGSDWSDVSWHAPDSWQRADVAWKSDRNLKFKSTRVKSGMTNRGRLQREQMVTLPGTDDEDLMVWMRTAALPHFTKLYRINKKYDLKKGDRLNLTIQNFWDVSDFSGTKRIVISTSGTLGGNNIGLAVGFLVIGCLSFIVFIATLWLIPQNSVSPYV